MSTSIRISDETKRKLESLKRDEESFDDLLSRLARSEKDVEDIAGFGPDGIDEHMRSKRREVNESFRDRQRPSTAVESDSESVGDDPDR